MSAAGMDRMEQRPLKLFCDKSSRILQAPAARSTTPVDLPSVGVVSSERFKQAAAADTNSYLRSTRRSCANVTVAEPRSTPMGRLVALVNFNGIATLPRTEGSRTDEAQQIVRGCGKQVCTQVMLGGQRCGPPGTQRFASLPFGRFALFRPFENTLC